MSFANASRRTAASASLSSCVSAMPGKQFLEQVDEAGPGPLGGKRIVRDAVDLEVGGARIGEAVGDMTVSVHLPIAAGLGQLLAERDDLVWRDHRVVPAVEGDDLGLDLLRRQAGRVEQAVEADRRGEVLAG